MKNIIRELLEDNLLYETRFKSILMLPTEDEDPFLTIDNILTFINNSKNVSLVNFNSWFFQNYSESPNRSYNSRKILERANLILVTVDKKVKLTRDGLDYIKMDTFNKKLLLAKNFSESYLGFLELLELCIDNIGKGKINSKLLFKTWFRRCEEQSELFRSYASSSEQFRFIKRYLTYFEIINTVGTKYIQPNEKNINTLLNKLS
jgi:hypothetical protein